METFTPTAIATLANEFAIDDLQLLFFTIELWNTSLPDIYLFCDSEVSTWLQQKKRYKGNLFTKEALNRYTGLSRKDMESMPGKTFKTLFGDFTAEKPLLFQWAFSQMASSKDENGLLFCDADICFLDALPQIPKGTQLALSPHMIRKRDTDKYGIYNAGFLWMNSSHIAELWFNLCKSSHFFEQGCLEDLKGLVKNTYEFPIQVNYGWWRMYQSDEGHEQRKKEFGVLRQENAHSGIIVQGKPLNSIHTHFFDTNDMSTFDFNAYMIKWFFILKKSQRNVNLLYKAIEALRQSKIDKKFLAK
jgi:hypothetical protein